jgi:hypothetical protein
VQLIMSGMAEYALEHFMQYLILDTVVEGSILTRNCPIPECGIVILLIIISCVNTSHRRGCMNMSFLNFVSRVYCMYCLTSSIEDGDSIHRPATTVVVMIGLTLD